MANNFVLSRPGEVQIGASGAAKDASANVLLGSCRTIELTWEADQQVATSTAAYDAIVQVSNSASKATLKIVAEEITAANVARALGGSATASGHVEYSGSGGVPTYYTVYAEGYSLGGTAMQLHVLKASVKPSGGLMLNNEQQTVELTMDVLYNPDASGNYKMFAIQAVT